MPIELTGHSFKLTLAPVVGTPTTYPCWDIAASSPFVPDLRTQGAFTAEDLCDLCHILTSHLGDLADSAGYNRESRLWLPYDLSLWIRWLDGDVERHTDGFTGLLSVRISLLAGQGLATGLRVYAGIEGAVAVEQAQAFCRAVQLYAADAPH